MSLRDSIQSCWDMALHHSVFFNVARIVIKIGGQSDDHDLDSLMPEFYGTITNVKSISVSGLSRCDKNKHIVTGVEINNDGRRKYFIKAGLITLQDKLVCSFLGWPLTLLESLVCLLFIPAALAVMALLVGICVLGVIPSLLFFQRARIEIMQVIGISFGFCLFAIPMGLIMAFFRLFQAIFRIPVGIGLLIKAGIDRYLGREMPSLNRIQSLQGKTVEEIRQLGIPVHVVGAPFITPSPTQPSIPSTVDVPSRYKCCIYSRA